jgi:hypothetical protein
MQKYRLTQNGLTFCAVPSPKVPARKKPTFTWVGFVETILPILTPHPGIAFEQSERMAPETAYIIHRK